MNMIAKFLLTTFLLLCGLVEAQEFKSTLAAEDQTASVVVSVNTAHDCKAAESWRWGAEGTCPKAVVSSLAVDIDKQSVFVPMSAFADLGNPRDVRIARVDAPARIRIVIEGGDAATAYSATFEFENGMLAERTVRSKEFPDEAWERTSYRFNF